MFKLAIVRFTKESTVASSVVDLALKPTKNHYFGIHILWE
jgi:hypothetical protein